MDQSYEIYEKIINQKSTEENYLYNYDLLRDFLQDDYGKSSYLYNFYFCNVQLIEKTPVPISIYELLWGWSEKDAEEKRCPDVMNSFYTYMDTAVYNMIDDKEYDENGLMEKSAEQFKKITGVKRLQSQKNLVCYLLRNKETRKIIEQKCAEMNELSRWADTIGNFILLPNTNKGKGSENSYKYTKYEDRMDLYLDQLCTSHYKNDEAGFRRYIDENYLWDYVDKDYNVISLFTGNSIDSEKDMPKLPKEFPKYKAFAERVIRIIKRRGIFMEIMIRLSDKSRQDVVSEIKNAEGIENYQNAIGIIEKHSKLTKENNIKLLLDELKGSL